MSNLLVLDFRGSIESLPQWFGFFVQQALLSITLDITEIIDLHLSDIEPNGAAARAATVFFRFLVAAGLVTFLWKAYKRRFFEETFAGSVKDFFWKCQNLLDRDTLEFRRNGSIDVFPEPERTVLVVDFIEALNERDYIDERAKRAPK